MVFVLVLKGLASHLNLDFFMTAKQVKPKGNSLNLCSFDFNLKSEIKNLKSLIYNLNFQCRV